MPWDVFISHAHEEQSTAAIPLLNALESANLSVWLDKQRVRAGDEIPISIADGLANSRCGVAILSRTYFDKPWATRELSAMYTADVQGRQPLIAICFDITPEEMGERFRLLASKRALLWSDGIPSIVQSILEKLSALAAPGAARVASDATHVVRADSDAGRQAPPDHVTTGPSPAASLAALLSPEPKLAIVPLERATLGANLLLVLRPQVDQLPFLDTLRSGTEPLGVAFGLRAMLGRVESIEQETAGGVDSCSLTLREQEQHYGNGFMQEMGFNGISSDAIAEIRAHRILLNAAVRPPSVKRSDLNDMLFENLVRGFGTLIKVEESPLPALFRDLRADPQIFVEAARLVSVLWLRLSATIERTVSLDMQLQGTRLHVHYVGIRPKRYSNVDPLTIVIDGDLELA